MKYDDKAKARDTKFRKKMKDKGYKRLSLWVKRKIIEHIKGLIHFENMKEEFKDVKEKFKNTEESPLCACYAFYLHGESINTCKCACHEEKK